MLEDPWSAIESIHSAGRARSSAIDLLTLSCFPTPGRSNCPPCFSPGCGCALSTGRWDNMSRRGTSIVLFAYERNAIRKYNSADRSAIVLTLIQVYMSRILPSYGSSTPYYYPSRFAPRTTVSKSCRVPTSPSNVDRTGSFGREARHPSRCKWAPSITRNISTLCLE